MHHVILMNGSCQCINESRPQMLSMSASSKVMPHTSMSHDACMDVTCMNESRLCYATRMNESRLYMSQTSVSSEGVLLLFSLAVAEGEESWATDRYIGTVLQYVAIVLQVVAGRGVMCYRQVHWDCVCSMLQVCCRALQGKESWATDRYIGTVLQYVASVLQGVAGQGVMSCRQVYWHVIQCVAVFCSALQC